jgi:hypothetical protein
MPPYCQWIRHMSIIAKRHIKLSCGNGHKALNIDKHNLPLRLCGCRTFQEWIELGAKIFDLLHREAIIAIMVGRRKN